ncbi:MAG: agmatine deiminase [Nitrospinaceae bacterium]|nr:MAG: agmatine deiminase [Nitrospinaceae bacterium]
MTDRPYPAAQGYRMPAEWEPHAATWLAWPHNRETWDRSVLPEVEKTYLAMIRVLVPGEEVHILVNDQASQKSVENKIRNAGITLDRVRLHIIPTKDAWIRDYGPNFLVSGEKEKRKTAFNNWEFDSWGGKYDDLLHDNETAGKIAQLLNLPTFEPGIVLEGGAIDVNGRGTCLTTEPCLLNPNRNGGMDKDTMEGFLKNYLGVKTVLWLKGGMEGDDTDGHIDNLARFVNPTTILCAYEEDSSDSNYKGLKDNYDTLKSATDQDGNAMNIIRLPMPGKVTGPTGRLPASYANFYIGNRSVLLPAYNKANDIKARSILQEAFPEREVVPIPCRELVQGFGSIHCVTQQQPEDNFK